MTLYAIKSPAGRYMSAGNQCVNSSGSMGRPPVWFDNKDCGWACCPDPSVRLAALGAWLIESLDRLRSRSRLGGEGGEGGEMVAKTEALLEDLQIGAKDDASGN